ncbi:iron-containing alcohol dehydrogenase family protein [Peribacillus asahii]|uniref:iron-containing alcohol dehydrogenase family protein n=1 Tax=Peribacillus asahii TaxID=228899 RepID=UPI0037F2F257
MSEFFYYQTVPIEFGVGKLQSLPDIIRERGYHKGLLITTKSIVANGIAERVVAESGGLITDFTYGIQPNPTVQNTDDCIEVLRSGKYDFAVALGGGSVLDCAKVTTALAPTTATTQRFFDGEFVLTEPGLPLIAVPTTAGTASEITRVSVLSDPVSGRKRPFNSPFLYPVYALIDPLLTMSCNKKVTASSGIDVLAHSLEALYSKLHQPFTDLFAKHAASLVFRYLQTAYDEPDNVEARTKMAEASVAAGMAFNITQTAAAHACSYPLTEMLDIPHGEACAFTLPNFWVLNAQDEVEGARLQEISRELGFRDAAHLAERVEELKQHLELRMSLQEIGVETDEQLQKIVEASFAPNIHNNPVTLTKESLSAFYKSI